MTAPPLDLAAILRKAREVKELAQKKRRFVEHAEANRDDWFGTLTPEITEDETAEAALLTEMADAIEAMAEEIKRLNADANDSILALSDEKVIAMTRRCSFDTWLGELEEAVIQGERGYEPGEFTVYPAEWHPLFLRGMTPQAAFRYALDMHACGRVADECERAINWALICYEDGRSP